MRSVLSKTVLVSFMFPVSPIYEKFIRVFACNWVTWRARGKSHSPQ
jgi:hypothetical protein